MLRSQLVLGALGAAAFLLGGLTACGGDTGTGGASGSLPAHPPERPSGASAGDGTGKVFGMSHIYIGTKARGSNSESADAWKAYGYDLDGQITAADYSNHCKPAAAADRNRVFPDGTDGRDNAFGRVVLPIIKAAGTSKDHDFEVGLHSAIAEGKSGIMLNITNLGANASYDPLNTLFLPGKGGTPVGNPTTWLAVPEFLNDSSDASSAKVKFTGSYLNANTWVSSDKTTVTLNLGIGGASLKLAIHNAIITMELDANHTSATNGVIAGVLNTKEFVDQLPDMLRALDEQFCSGAAVESVLNLIRQASDIMADGSQDPNATCDGISIGIGFDATEVTIGGVGTPAEMTPPPCEP